MKYKKTKQKQSRVTLSLPSSLVDWVDTRREDVPRSRYFARIVEDLASEIASVEGDDCG